MKFRSDFVTNSSSSSFIIGNIGDGTTIDMVFNIIKEFYIEYLGKKDALMKDKDKLKIEWNEKEHRFKFINNDNSWQKNEALERDYGIDTWAYFGFDTKWLEFKTYDEYVDYWIEKIEKSDAKNYVHAPFSIIDYTASNKYAAIHYGKTEYLEECDIRTLATENAEFGWYFPCHDELVTGKKSKYNYCDYCSIDKKTCEETKAKFKSREYTNENALINILGTICIRSESGYIPEFVVNKLREISNYSCNHMG